MHGARVGVRGELLLHQVLQLGGEFVTADITVAQHHECLQDLAAQCVGHADHSRVGDLLVQHEHAFHLERADAVAGHDDHVVVAGGEVEEAVLVLRARIAGDIPTPVRGVALGSAFGGVEVAEEPQQRAVLGIDGDATELTGGGDDVGVVGQHRARPAGQRPPHRARGHLGVQRLVPGMADDHAVFGLTIVVADRDTEMLQRPRDDLGGQRLPGRRGAPQRGMHRRRDGVGAQRAVHGRGGGQVGDTEAVQHVPDEGGREPGIRQNAAHTGGQRGEDRVIQAVRPAGVRDIPKDIVLADIQREFLIRVEGGQRAQRNRHALRSSGGATGEQLHQQSVAADRHGFRQLARAVAEQVRHAEAARGRVTADDDLPRCVGRYVGPRRQLRRLVGIGDDDRGAARLQPERDGGRRECGEQRNMHRPATPDPQQRHHQVRRLRHQRRDPITLPDAEFRQPSGESRRALPQFTIGEIGRGQITLDDGERDSVRRMPIAQQVRG